MRNMSFSNTTGEYGGLINKISDWQSLKNEYALKKLFRHNYYNLITGNFSVLEILTTSRFLEQIIDHAGSTSDKNLIPALKKIEGDNRLDKGLRQRSSATIETIEDYHSDYYNKTKSLPGNTEEEKTAFAKGILEDTRLPPTTEILRLLRDKSIEVKRLGIYIIGKFRLTDLSQEVCECLNNRDLASDAYNVLQDFGSKAGDALQRFYLLNSGNTIIRKVALRFFGKSCTQENTSFVLALLSSNSRQIKEGALKSLIECRYKAREDEKERLCQIVSETGGIITWILSVKVCLEKNNETFLKREISKEFSRWKEFLAGLVSLIYAGSGVSNEKDSDNKDLKKSDSIPAWLKVVFDESSGSGTRVQKGSLSDKKRLKKLNRYFPSRMPQYITLHEDIINCDYNLISIWTKACAVRNIPEIDNEDLGESTVALLFSPEEILREEAAKLIARSGKELYNITSQRIGEKARERLDKIVSGSVHDKDLIYEKVIFLASCFEGIPGDELCFLAGRMIFMRDYKTEMPSVPEGYVLWQFMKDKPEPDVYIHNAASGNTNEPIRSDSDYEYCYLLPLNAVEDFIFLCDERSFEILKYIDDNEE